MLRILDMAFRNIGRNKRRSALAVTSVFLSIALVLVTQGLTGGILGSLVKNYTKNDTGHVNIATAEYRKRERFMPVPKAIRDSGAVLKAIRDAPEVSRELAFAAERIRFGVILSSGARSKTALGLAGDPEIERSLLMLDRSVMPGGVYCTEKGTAILGQRLASTLGLGVGDALKVITQRADYGLGFKKFRISGLFKTGVNALDDSAFQIRLDDARELLGLGRGATQIVIMLKDYSRSPAVAQRLEAALASAGFKDLSVLDWNDIGEYGRLVAMAGGIYLWVWIVIAFLGAFIIANVMTMVVLERRKEIGILKAMGMQSGEILMLFLIEGMLLGAIGSAAGALAGLGFNIIFAGLGIDFTSAMAMFEWPFDNVIYTSVNPAAALAFFLMGTAIASIVSFLPSRSAANMNPIDAIRAV